MRNPVCLMVALLVVCPVWAAAPPMTPGWADRLVEQLGDDDFDTREAAAKALDKAGGDAVPALRRGMQSKDAEIRARSLKIAKAIEARTAAFFEALGVEVQWHRKRVDVLSCFDRDASKLRDEHLRELVGLPWLVNLELKDAPVSDAGMAHIGRLTGLKRLSLGGTKVTDLGLAHLACLVDLESFDLGRAAGVTGGGLAHLGGLVKVQSLSLIRSGVTDAGLNAGIAGVKRMAKLKTLSLSYTRIGDDGIVRLGELPQPIAISLGHTRVTDRGIAHLKAMPDIQGVDLESTAVTDAGCQSLAQIKTLQGMRLGRTAVTIVGLRNLKVMPNLRWLNLEGNKLTLEEIKELCEFMPKRVNILGDNVQRNGVEP